MTGALVAIGSPATAVLANAAFSTIGTLVFAASRASRAWRGDAFDGMERPASRPPGSSSWCSSSAGSGWRSARWRSRPRRFATQLGSPGLAGALIAVQAAASMAGGLWYGSREHHTRAGERYPRLCLLIALGFAPLFLIGSMASALPLMALSGFAFAPAGAVLYLLIDDLAPAGAPPRRRPG